MAIGLPLTGMRNRRAEPAPCVLDGEAAEHEGVARIARDGFDARLQPLVGREFAAQVELADIFLEKADEIGGAIGQRRIDADIGAIEAISRGADAHGLVAALIVHVALLGHAG